MRGISYREKIYPQQLAMTQLSNAVHEKQLREAGFGVNFYDIDRVNNPHDLDQRSVDGPIYVAANNLGA